MSQSTQQNMTNLARGTEVFVGGLAPTVTEDKIHEVFSACGEIMEIRMIKDQKGHLKGFCFVRFTTKEAADKAVKEKSGYAIDGKQIGVRPSIEQDTLFLGNLHKGWNQEEFEKFVRQVFPDVISVNLAMLGDVELSQKQQNRGFGFVKFSSHAAAARAYRAASLSDFVLAGSVRASVKWAEEEPEIDPEELAQIKTAFVRNLPVTADENYLKKLFEPFGKVEKVVLSKKGKSQIGFIYYDKRQDLDNALLNMNEKVVQGPNGGPTYKLQVEVARPLDKKRKRVPDDAPSKPPTKGRSQSTFLQDDLRAQSPVVHGFRSQQEQVHGDPYEYAVIALPIAVKERLLRILRLGIATRFDINAESLSRIKELPESTAISVLDQFMLSGAEVQDKGAYLAGLISRNQADKVRLGQLPLSFSRVESTLSREPLLSGSSSRMHLPADSFDSQIGSTDARSDIYSYRYSPLFSDNYLSSQATLGRAKDARLSALGTTPSDSTANIRIGLSSHAGVLADLSPMHTTPSSSTDMVRIGLNSHFESPADRSLSPFDATPSAYTGNGRSGLSSYIEAPTDLRLSPTQTMPRQAAYGRAGLISHIATTADRRLSPQMMPPISAAAYSRAGLTSHTATAADRRPPTQMMPSISSTAYSRLGSHTGEPTTDHQPPRHQVRFDPFTGEPYKFDPFTGEPILPESSSRRF